MAGIQSKIETLGKLFLNYRVKHGLYAKRGDRPFSIVMYHGIDQVQNTKYNLRFFSRDNFEAQIRTFSKHFNILTHDDLVAGRLSDKKPNLLITFDDGYWNNYAYALPVLERYNAHAYFFITGVHTLEPKVLWADAVNIVAREAKQKSRIDVSGVSFELQGDTFMAASGLDLITMIWNSKVAGYEEKSSLVSQLLALYDFTKQEELKDHWLLMNEEEIRKCSASKCITIGSHGFYHHNLGSLDNADAVAEVLKSKNYLENIIQKPVTTIGFPDGSYTTELNKALFDLGFNKQFIVDHRFDDAGIKDYVYDRIGLYPYMGNANELLYKMLH